MELKSLQNVIKKKTSKQKKTYKQGKNIFTDISNATTLIKTKAKMLTAHVSWNKEQNFKSFMSLCMCVWWTQEWKSGFYLMSEKMLRSQFKIRLNATICAHSKWTYLKIVVNIIIIVITIICLFKLGRPVTSVCDCLDSIYWCLSVNWLSVKSTTLNGGDCGASHLQEEECHKVNAADRSRPGNVEISAAWRLRRMVATGQTRWKRRTGSYMCPVILASKILFVMVHPGTSLFDWQLPWQQARASPFCQSGFFFPSSVFSNVLPSRRNNAVNGRLFGVFGYRNASGRTD